jgi:hypothetical protein
MKKILLTSILILGLFIVGCSSGTDTTTAGQQGVFIGGTEGLVATFEPIGVEENGVQTVYDTENFPLEILLKNKGEENVEIGKVSLRLLGPPETDFQNIPSWKISNKKMIEKVSEFNPEGGEEVTSFTSSNLAKYTRDITSFTDINWNVEYAYDYKTHVIINDVCFKGDISDNRICEVKGSKTFALSGAPIAVTSVQEETGGKGIVVLKIGLSNIGLGDSTIIGQEYDTRFSQVGYTIDEPHLWECKSGGREGTARFVDGKAEVICKLKKALKEDDLFTKVVTFTINYNYRELVTEKLRIKESIS